MIRRVYSFVLVSSLSLVLSSTAQASFVTIGNFSDWDKNQRAGFLGVDNTAAADTFSSFGQTFTVGASHTVLTEWTFYIDRSTGSGFNNPFNARLHIYEWNNPENRATGSALFQSSTLTATGANDVGDFENFVFNTGNTSLLTGKTYIAIMSTSGIPGQQPSRANVGGTQFNTYLDGGFFVLDDNNNPASWVSTQWGESGEAEDLAFTATFSDPTAIPEPTSLALVGIVSCVAAGRVALRRRRRAGVPASAGQAQKSS